MKQDIQPLNHISENSRRTNLLTILLIALALFQVQALPHIGYTDVNTLRFRYGAEGIALGECGTAFSSELASTYYNPANVPFYGSRNDVTLAVSGGYEPLLPSLKLENLHNNDFEIAAMLPFMTREFSFAFQYSLHSTTFGPLVLYNMDGSPSPDNFEFSSKELISGFTLASSWNDWISMGITLKRFTSKLSGTTNSIDTTGTAWDFGLRGQYRFSGKKGFYVQPGIGLSLNSIGKDVSYDNGETSNPIPSTFRTGASVETGLQNRIWLVSMIDTKKLIAKSEHFEFNEQWAIPSLGFQLGLTPLLQLNCGFIMDDIESIEEFHWGFTAGYRQKQFREFIDRKHVPQTEESFKNFQIIYSLSSINPYGMNNIHQNQTAHQLSASMAFGKKKPFFH